MKNKDVSMIVLVFFFLCFGDRSGVRGSIFDPIFGRSKNVPKKITIDGESLISHVGII